MIDIPHQMWPASLLNINLMRGQTRHHNQAIQAWRTTGRLAALKAHQEAVQTPVRIWVQFRFPTNRRRDTCNLMPTCKALIDGLVDAKVLPDDCDGIIEGPFPIRVYPNGPELIRIGLEHVPADRLGRIPVGACR